MRRLATSADRGPHVVPHGAAVVPAHPWVDLVVALAGLIACAAAPNALDAQETASTLEARVWLDRGDEPVLHRGENVRVYYRTNEDAYAAIFRIDTDGRVELIYPQHPGAVDVVRANRDYRLLFSDGPAWRVSEDPGVGYLFIVASPEPLDLSSFPYHDRYGWDVSAVGDVVYTDPYVAIDDYVARVVPDWELVPYALDFVTYSVGETHSYPRFLCYDCHTYQTYSAWNPYDYTCSTFRVVIWDDPYFYPRYRYSGVNVVVASRPVRASLPRYEVTRRVVGDAVRPVVRTRPATARRVAEYKEPATSVTPGVRAASARPPSAVLASPATRVQGPPRQRPSAVPQERPGTVPQERPGAAPQERPRTAPQEAPDSARSRPTLQRRPSSRLPVRTPPSRTPARPSAQPEPSAPAPARGAPARLPDRSPPARSNATPERPDDRPAASSPPAARSSRPSTSRPSRAPTQRATPGASRQGPAPAPSRPSSPPARAVPAPGADRPSAGRSQPQAAPRPRAASPRAGAGSNGGASRPSAPPARAAPAPRSEEPRPTVRPRAPERR